MTYCLGIKINKGLLFMSDTRTNAGVDNISTFKKIFTFNYKEKVYITILASGNLAPPQVLVNSLNEIFREKRRDKGGGFDANAAAEKEEGGGILSRKTMEFWEAVVSRIEFEYEKEMKKTMDSSQIERLDAVGYKIEAAAKRIRAQYNNFLSRYVYALDAKWKDDKENRSRSEAIDNLKLRVLLLKDAVMKRSEREASRIFSKKFALEAKHLLVDLKMPSPEAVTLYHFLLANVERREER